MAYVDGYVIPVPSDNKEAYQARSAALGSLFTSNGATQVMDCWGDDVPDGEQTSFRKAVAAQTNENVVLVIVIWPSKAVREAGIENVMADPMMQPASGLPFDARRLIYGTFEVLAQA